MSSPGEVDAAKVVVYENEAGEWCWSARDTNGEEVANSGDDGYSQKYDAKNAAQDLFPDAEMIVPAEGVVAEDG